MAKTTKKSETNKTGLTTNVLDVTGKAIGTLTLPKEVFGQEIVRKELIAQAVRVFLANQREGGAATKTRGNVEGSTRKIYRQKGTGRARHGSIRAPIFVGGGIVFGPVQHNFTLNMPKKMKDVALSSALTLKQHEGSVIVVDGLDALKPKTKFIAKALQALEAGESVLLVVSKDAKNVIRAAQNIQTLDTIRSVDISTYHIQTHKKIIFEKNAIDEVKSRFV